MADVTPWYNPKTRIDMAVRTAPIAHRTAVAAADTCPTITITAVDQPATAGSLAAVQHGIAVAPGNIYGSAGASAIVIVTPTVDKSIDITIPQSTGATYYDVFLSTSTTAPKKVARITETQRAAGCAITGVGTVGAGGAAGKANVRVVGTGLACTDLAFTSNNAYRPEAVAAAANGLIDCAGYTKVYLNVTLTSTVDTARPTVTIIPFLSANVVPVPEWYQGAPVTISSLTGAGESVRQAYEMDVGGAKYATFLLDQFGTGTTVTIGVERA
jgi:hypothetical protein